MSEYGKLVRDRIPEIIEQEGRRCEVATLDEAAFLAALRAKLVEEAGEVAAADPGDLSAELADVLEFVDALAAAAGLTTAQVREEQRRRRDVRGGFDRRLWLARAE